MTPYYQDDLVTIYHGDCQEWMPEADAVVSDPPYGMGWDASSITLGPNGHGKHRDKSIRPGIQIVGDDQPFDPAPCLGFSQVILWGSNHYSQALPGGTTLVWVKRLTAAYGSYLSDAEIAWMKGGHGVYLHLDLSLNAERRHRLHGNQKPLGLMRWCIGKTTGTILDPYAGSGTTLVAAKSLGRKSIGIEIEERYCEVAANRCRQEVLGLSA